MTRSFIEKLGQFIPLTLCSLNQNLFWMIFVCSSLTFVIGMKSYSSIFHEDLLITFSEAIVTKCSKVKQCPMRSHQKDLWHYSLNIRFCCGLGSCTCCCLLMRSDVTLHGSSSNRTATSSCCTGAWCNASITVSFQVLFLYYDVTLQQLIWIIPTTNMLK